MTGNWVFVNWMLLGICIGASGLWAYNRIIALGAGVKWFDWLMTALAVFLLGFMLQNFFMSFAEHQPRAAWMFVIFLGVPIALLCAFVWRNITKRIKAAG